MVMIKGQLILKPNCQAVNSSKKRTNEFVFTAMRRVFLRFLEEIEDTKETFRKYLTYCIFFVYRSYLQFQTNRCSLARAAVAVRAKMTLAKMFHAEMVYRPQISLNAFFKYTVRWGSSEKDICNSRPMCCSLARAAVAVRAKMTAQAIAW